MQRSTVIARRAWLGRLGVLLATTFSTALAQARRARLGWLALVPLSSPGVRARFDAFLSLMQQKGWTEASNLDFEPRGPAPGTTLAAAAAELVALKPDVIVSSGTPALTILRDLTTEIPIVMAGAGDPVGTGLVASLARPGGNITGVSWQLHELIPKTLSLLHEMAPGMARLDFLNQTNDPGHEFFAKVTVDAARQLGLTCQALQVGKADDVLAAIAASKADGVVMLATQMIYVAPERIAAAAIRRGLPLAIDRRPRTRSDSGGLPVLLLRQQRRNAAPDGGLRRPHPARREARGHPGAAAHALRLRDQPEDGARDRAEGSASAAVARRRGHRMKRRQAINAATLALVAWPPVLLGQTPLRTARIAFLIGGAPSPITTRTIIEPFVQGLREAGFVESRNLVIDTRWAEGKLERLPGLLAEQLALRPNLILAAGPAPALAAKAVTSTVPIVAAPVDDPVLMGLVHSMARPGGNITGVSGFGGELVTRRLQLLKDFVPQGKRFAVLALRARLQGPAGCSEAERGRSLARWHSPALPAAG